MKKFLILTLVTALTLTLFTACSSGETVKETTTPNNTTNLQEYTTYDDRLPSTAEKVTKETLTTVPLVTENQQNPEKNTTPPANKNNPPAETNSPTQKVPETITKEKAKSIVLSHAVLKENEISRYRIELDRERNILVYEIEFDSGKYEYEYEINAETGKIIKAEKEFRD